MTTREMELNFFDNMNSVRHEATCGIQVVVAELTRPSIMLKPRIFMDGNQWCALYGDNLQDGVAGFGDSPELAFADFDRSFAEKLNKESHP